MAGGRRGSTARTRRTPVIVEEPGRRELLLRVAVPRRCLLGEADCCEGDVDDVELFRERLDHDAEALDAVLEELLAQRGAEHLEPALAEVGDGRDLGELESRPGRPLDVAQETLLARFDERDRDALAPGATRPADAVDVRLGVRRDVVVDDVRDVLDVEPARRDVGRDEDVEGTVAETVHHAVALVLRHAAVQRCGVVAVAGELLGKVLDLAARPGEDQRRGRVFEVEDAPERGRLVRAAHDVGDLPHAGGGAALPRLRLDRDPDRLVEVALGDAGDLRRDRRGEEGRLTRGRDRGQHRIEVLGEAHVEHLVGLVEHDELDGIEVQAAPRQMVDGAARRRDDEVDTAAQAAQLLADRLPAVHRQHADAR